jgi:hypothetical protein
MPKHFSNDAIDASAIVKAVLDPDMRFANVKESKIIEKIT